MPASIRRAQAARTCARQLARVIAMDGDIDGLLPAADRLDKFVGNALRIGDRHARMPADHLYMRDGFKLARQRQRASGGQHEGIAAGDDDFPDFGMRADVGERSFEFGR